MGCLAIYKDSLVKNYSLAIREHEIVICHAHGVTDDLGGKPVAWVGGLVFILPSLAQAR
jgi:hypothetical protein